MLPETRITISGHALRRYRERIGATTPSQLIELVRRSQPAGRKMRQRFREMWRARGCPGDPFRPDSIYFFHYGRKVYFILRVVRRGHFALITCWPLAEDTLCPGKS